MNFEPLADGYLMRAEGVCDGKRVEERPQRFILDGVERPLPDFPEIVGVANQPNPNTIRASARAGDRTLGEGIYVISEDGSTLTATVTGIDTQHRTFQTTVVWDRK